MDLLDAMVEHAQAEVPNECCGLIVARGKKTRLMRCRNVSETPRTDFEIDPQAWLELEEGEEVVAVYHSHPFTSPEPSMADLAGCESSGLPWHIVTPIGGHRYIEPSGYQAPYVGRPYVYGVLDCFTLVRDYYRREYGIDLPELERPRNWWLSGLDLYRDNFERYGFVRVDGENPIPGDAFLIQVFSPVPNHAAIYLGDGKILHHVQGRLSTIDVWGGMWERSMTHHLRHSSLVKARA
jgi:proteasome lid subunit RPN8/RPN11